ncbi:MAG: SurA N-terminal domain-containing protein [Proteobacteria bacterium]|nr:SurA N-terminal domain-containing protein [Pseudomonadota bacterium]
MLQNIHDMIKGWVGYVLLGAIAIVFVLWGINFTMGAPSYAAKVDGREIPAAEMRQTYQQELARAERAAQGQLTESQRNEIKTRVLEDSVSIEALIARLQDLGYRVSESDLLKAMAQIPAFQVDGKFDSAHAVAVLKAQGRSIPEVESMIRRQIQISQLETALRGSSFATDTEARELAALTQQQREASWVVVTAAHFLPQVQVDDAAIKAWYDQHKADYMTPETLDVRYIELNLPEMAARISVNDAQLRAFFAEQKAKNPEKFIQPEQRRVSHILLTVNDPKEDAAVKAKAEEIYKQASAGEDFGSLAKRFSQDKASAEQGGDLGWSDRKLWVAPFADAAFSMKVGEIRGPVKTQFGYHILKLVGIKPQVEKTFEESRSDLEAQYRRNEAERMFNTAQDQLADAALQNATDIDAVAKKTGLPVKQVDGFSRTSGGGALGNSPKVLDAIFSSDVIDGRLSQLIEVEKGRDIVVRGSNHRLPQQKSLESVRAEVTAAVKAQRSEQMAAAAAQAAVKSVDGGETMDQLAKSLGSTVSGPKPVARSDQAVPLELREALFMAPKPAGKPVVRTVKLGNGDAAIFAFTGIKQDPLQDIQARQLRRQYADALADTEAMDYANAVRAAAKVELNPQALE